MKKKLYIITQKYKGLQEITMNSYMPIKWTIQRKQKMEMEMYNLPKLNQEEIETINRSTTSTETELVIKQTNKQKTPKKQKSWTRQIHRSILPNT